MSPPPPRSQDQPISACVPAPQACPQQLRAGFLRKQKASGLRGLPTLDEGPAHQAGLPGTVVSVGFLVTARVRKWALSPWEGPSLLGPKIALLSPTGCRLPTAGGAAQPAAWRVSRAPTGGPAETQGLSFPVASGPFALFTVGPPDASATGPRSQPAPKPRGREFGTRTPPHASVYPPENENENTTYKEVNGLKAGAPGLQLRLINAG